MKKVKFLRGDKVIVIAGKGRSAKQQGKVLSIDRKEGRLIVEGVNMVSKHQKQRSERDKGGIIKMEAPIQASNVMLLHKGKPTRIGYKFVDGKKVRFAKSTGEIID